MAEAFNITTNSTSSSADETLYFSCLGVLGSLGILFNGLLLFVLWRNKTPEFRSGTTYIIGNLALADCLTGVAVVIYTINSIAMNNNQTVKVFQLSWVWTSVQASLLSLMVLSIERTIVFSCPFASSSSIVTTRRTIMIILSVWIISAGCGLAVYYDNRPAQFGLTVVFEVSVIVFLIGQAFIFVKMKQRNREIRLYSHEVSKNTRKLLRQSSNSHVIKVVLILITVVVVTVLPYMIGVQLLLWSMLGFEPPLSASCRQQTVKFVHYYYPIELINFVINPIIYGWRLQRYRRAFIRAFPCLKFLQSKRAFTRQSSSGMSHEHYAHYRKDTGISLLRAT